MSLTKEAMLLAIEDSMGMVRRAIYEILVALSDIQRHIEQLDKLIERGGE